MKSHAGISAARTAREMAKGWRMQAQAAVIKLRDDDPPL